MNERGQFLLALGGMIAATLLAVLGVISGETWVAFLVGAVMPSPFGRRPPDATLPLLCLALLGCGLQDSAEMCLVGHIQRDRPQAQSGVAADYVRLGAQASQPAACSGFGCLYTKNTDNLPRLVGTSGTEFVAGEAWRAHSSAGAPSGATTSWLWYDTTAGAFYFQDASGAQALPAPANLCTLSGIQTLTGAKTFSGGITMSGATIAMGSQKITGLALGTASGEAVAAQRSISVTAPITGGGDLTANRTIGLSYSSTYFDLSGGALIAKAGALVYQTVSGGGTGALGAATVYLGGVNTFHGGTEYYQAIATRAGTARNLRCYLQVAPGGADTVAFTARINGADSAVTCTITGAGQSCSDTSNTAATAAGDRLSTKAVSSAGTAASATCSFEVTN